jgi:hypothetical protein
MCIHLLVIVSFQGSDGDHGRQDLYEVIKRKGDQLLPPGIPASETGLGSGTDASELPAPPGSKKPKVSDANSEAMPGPIQPASQTGQQPVSLGVSKPIRHNINRDRSNRKIKSSKVRGTVCDWQYTLELEAGSVYFRVEMLIRAHITIAETGCQFLICWWHLFAGFTTKYTNWKWHSMVTS